MSWIASLLASIGAKILAWAFGLIADAIARWNEMRAAKNKIEDLNQQVLDLTKKAETKEERDRAAEEIIRKF